jgi:hypothetical protein
VKRCERVAGDVKIAKGQELIPRALAAQEKTRLFRVARSNPCWYRALYVAVMAANTTERKHEILRAPFQDIDLFSGLWRISKSKTETGRR